MDIEEIKYTISGLISALFDEKERPETLTISVNYGINNGFFEIDFSESVNKISELLYYHSKEIKEIAILNNKKETIHTIQIK